MPVTQPRLRSRVSVFTGTSSEFLGSKSLPHSIKAKPNVFIFGPSKSGKTMVGKRILGNDVLLIRQLQLMDHLTKTIRNDCVWDDELVQHPRIMIELPPLLSARPFVRKLIQEFLETRTSNGHRTVILEAEDLAPTQAVLGLIDFKDRALLILRFPEGRGRYRFAAHACRSRNIPLHYSKVLGEIPDWTYEKMFAELNIIEANLKNQKSGKKQQNHSG